MLFLLLQIPGSIIEAYTLFTNAGYTLIFKQMLDSKQTNMMKKLILIWILLITTSLAWAQSGPYRRVSFEASPQQIKELLKAGVSLENTERKGNSYTGDYSNEEYTAIKKYTSKNKVLISDVSKYYAKRSEKALRKTQKKSAATPVNFHLGTMAGFMRLNEIEDELDSMKARFPSIITIKQSIGNTYENRPIYFVKISDNPSVNETDEPEVLYDGMHHAREPMAMTQMIYFMWYLLENYENDYDVTYLINNRELYFVPIVNPDGYALNELVEPQGGGMWRKNTRDNGDGTSGVDLNRNYAKSWGIDDFGSSPFGQDETYRGTAPFSEPETQAMRDFINMHEFKTNLSAHSFHNVLIYPWGPEENIYTPDSTLFREYAEEMTAVNQYIPGTVFEVLGYVTNGGSVDWLYGDTTDHEKIISMTPEVGALTDGFWPLPERIIPLASDNIEMNLLNAWFAGAYVQATILNEQSYHTESVTIPVQYLSKGLEENIHLHSYLEFTEGNMYIGSNIDTIKKDSIKTLSTYSDEFHITFNSPPINTVFKAVMHTQFNEYEKLDTIQFTYIDVVGIQKQKAFDFSFAPNPANDLLKISYEKEFPATLQVYTESGILIAEKKLNGPEVLSVDGFRPGTYLLRLQSGNKISTMKKLIIQ